MANSEAVNDRAKLLMHRIIARTLVNADGAGDVLGAARRWLARLEAESRVHRDFGEWRRLLDLPPDRLRREITCRGER